MKKTKILIVDDHAIMRKGLLSLLESYKDFEIIGDTADGETALRLAKKLMPDVVVTDLIMPGMDGAELTRRLSAECPGIGVLILTTFGTANSLGEALSAGAKGAVLKSASCDELVAAIRSVADGKTAISPEVRQLTRENPPLPKLSDRHAQLLDSIARGLTNEDIAEIQGTSVATVKKHLRLVFLKLGVATRAEAIALALCKHLLKM